MKVIIAVLAVLCLVMPAQAKVIESTQEFLDGCAPAWNGTRESDTVLQCTQLLRGAKEALEFTKQICPPKISEQKMFSDMQPTLRVLGRYPAGYALAAAMTKLYPCN
jgi:hypothetical protein